MGRGGKGGHVGGTRCGGGEGGCEEDGGGGVGRGGGGEKEVKWCRYRVVDG